MATRSCDTPFFSTEMSYCWVLTLSLGSLIQAPCARCSLVEPAENKSLLAICFELDSPMAMAVLISHARMARP